MEHQHLMDRANKVYQQPLDRQQLNDVYAEWSNHQDLAYNKVHTIYHGPRLLAEHVHTLLAQTGRDVRDIKILDVGAGTGLVAQELRRLADYTNLEALDPCLEMLQVAKNDKLYSKYYAICMEGMNSTDLPSEEYDCVLSSGAVLVPNHVPLEGLSEMIRITKRGGLVAWIMREVYLDQPQNEIQGKFQQHHLWKIILEKEFPNYIKGVKGILYIFQKQ